MDGDTSQLMHEALVGAGTSVWAWDMDADVLTGMSGSVSLLGYDDGELESTQAGWNTVIHPDDLADNDAAYLRHARGETPAYESEYRARAKNGSWRWLAERGRIVEWWADGRPRRMVGTLSDVTLRHQAESETAARDERLREITRHVPGLLYQFRLPRGGHGVVPYVSERCLDVLGVAPQALMEDARVVFKRIDPADLSRVVFPLAEWMNGPTARRIEFRYLHPSGQTRWMLAVSSPRPEPDGSAVVWHGYLEDITEHRELANARELAAAAEAANHAKTEFLSRMSHELRTPLNAVLGFAQLMELDETAPLSEGQRQRLTLVRESGEHLLRMIGDLLDHSRIETGQLAVDLLDVPLLPLLRECTDMLAPAAQAAGVSLRCDASPALQVHADSTRLKQVLLNLVSNAIKYNRAGGEVRLEAQARADEICLRVIDNGVGIAPAHMSSLFEPFNRLGQRRSGVEGTGIGLAITRALVTLMRGRIEVHSEPGLGSTFSVWLPAAADQSTSLPT